MNQLTEIKTRLTQSFSNLQGKTKELHDPAIQLIADALASELSALQLERQQSERRILKKLTETLQPERSDRKRPLCGLACITPRSAVGHLTKEHCLEVETATGKEAFSPLFDITLFKGKVDWVVSRHAVFQQENAGVKRPYSMSSSQETVRENEIWLGLSLDDAITNPEGMSLFLDWEATGGKTAAVLSLLQAEWNGLRIKVGTELPQRPFSPPDDLAEQLFLNRGVEQPALDRFADRFLFLGCFLNEMSKPFKETKIHFPCGEASLPWAAEPLHWLKLVFPVPLSAGEISKMPFSINYTPILNRRLCRTQIYPEDTVHVLPLETKPGEGFLALHKVFSKTGSFYPAIAPDFGKAPAGSYALHQGGVTTLDIREGRQQVDYLLYLLKTEAAIMKNVFKVGGRGDVEELLQRLEKTLSELENRLPETHPGETNYFLQIKPKASEENVFVEYWVAGNMEDAYKEIVITSSTLIDSGQVYMA